MFLFIVVATIAFVVMVGGGSVVAVGVCKTFFGMFDGVEDRRQKIRADQAELTSPD